MPRVVFVDEDKEIEVDATEGLSLLEVARQHDHRVITYAIHFGQNYPNELEFARSVDDRLGTEHHEVLISPRRFATRL